MRIISNVKAETEAGRGRVAQKEEEELRGRLRQSRREADRGRGLIKEMHSHLKS